MRTNTHKVFDQIVHDEVELRVLLRSTGPPCRASLLPRRRKRRTRKSTSAQMRPLRRPLARPVANKTMPPRFPQRRNIRPHMWNSRIIIVAQKTLRRCLLLSNANDIDRISHDRVLICVCFDTCMFLALMKNSLRQDKQALRTNTHLHTKHREIHLHSHTCTL